MGQDKALFGTKARIVRVTTSVLLFMLQILRQAQNDKHGIWRGNPKFILGREKGINPADPTAARLPGLGPTAHVLG